MLGDFNNLIQLGIGADNTDPTSPVLISIPKYLKDQFILKGKYGLTVDPLDVNINDLDDSYQNMLIRLTNVEFTDADADQFYADAINKISINRRLKDCLNNQIILRSSGYANFANTRTPSGRGSLVAIYSVFRNDKQLYIRDLNDVSMTGLRCDESLDLITISSVRSAFTGTTTTAPFGKIKGVVISDRANGNINSRNIVIQDATAGITVRFAANHPYNLGDEVEVVLTGQELSEFNGLLQLNNVPLANATLIGLGTLPAPQEVTIATLLANFENYESELVKIVNATITGSGSTYNGTRTLTDATGSIDLFTLAGASFSGTAYPTGTVNITGIVAQGGAGSNKQITIRSTLDVETVTLPGPLLYEDFESTSTGTFTLPGWTNVATVGTKLWTSNTFESNRYIQFNPKAGGTPEDDNECWVITPSIALGTGNVLTFRPKIRFPSPGHAPVTVYVATNFNGSNAATANWTQLTANFSDTEDEWEGSGNVSLSSYNGQTIHIGFKYDGSGTDDDRSSAMQVDNVKVE